MTSFELVVLGWIIVALIILPFNLKIKAPYGRHANNKWGPTINNKAGWFIMELPALTLTPLIAIRGTSEQTNAFYLILGLWLLHYVHRTAIFPFMTKTSNKRIPVSIVIMAMIFNGVNGALNGYFLGYIHTYLNPWLENPLFIGGVLIFLIGMAINISSDYKLIKLRSENTQYQIPRGGIFNLISCPNHFGEIIEWFGYSILTWSPAALSFAIWTFANLVPRSLAHHQWYKKTFDSYPVVRKAVFPYLL